MEPNLLASKFTPGFDQTQKYIKFCSRKYFKSSCMRTQTKFTHEYFFFLDYKLVAESGFKACTHGAICIRVQILHICKICIRMQIAPCVHIYSRMQNLHVCKSWKICTCLRPSANLILRICKFCMYANLVM